MIQKLKHKNHKQKHEMCKTNVKTDFYYANICKHEHEKKLTKLWCKIMFKTSVEHSEVIFNSNLIKIGLEVN